MRRALLAVLACLVLSAGCSSAAAPEPGAAGATLSHRYGTTTVPADPQRVVTVGFTDHDAVLALGVTPVAYTNWLAEGPLPWEQADPALTDAPLADAPLADAVRLDQTAPDVEAIAAARPDLILAVHSALTQDQYDTLSGIAPTVAQSADHPDFGTPWQEQTRTIGTALGRAGQADALVADVEARFAEARAAHAEFAGVTAAAGLTGADGTYGPADARSQFLAALGFTPSEEIAGLAGATASPPRSAPSASTCSPTPASCCGSPPGTPSGPPCRSCPPTRRCPRCSRGATSSRRTSRWASR